MTVVISKARPVTVVSKDAPAHVQAAAQKVRRGDVKRAVIVRYVFSPTLSLSFPTCAKSALADKLATSRFCVLSWLGRVCAGQKRPSPAPTAAQSSLTTTPACC